MNDLLAQAASGLEQRLADTAHYRFSIDGLKPSRKIVAYVKRQAKRELASRVGEDDSPYLEAIRKGGGRYTSARKLGIDPKVIYDRLEADDEFRIRVEIAEAESLEDIVQVVRQSAQEKDLKAATFLLERKSTKEYGAPTKNININSSHHVDFDQGELSRVDADIKRLELVVRQQAANKQLEIEAGVIDIPYEDTEEI